MAEFRLDRLTGHWALISPERQRRPLPAPPKWPAARKTFTPMLEKIFPIPDSDDQIEIHRNLFPAVTPWLKDGSRARVRDPFVVPGQGTVLLIKFKKNTTTSFSDKAREVFAQAVQSLYSQYRAERGMHMLALFCNSGREAGASLALPHYQFWALPVHSPADQLEVQWLKSRPRCETCELLKDKKFIVAQNKLALSVSRPAARLAGELLIMPRRHVQSFTQLTVEERNAMMQLLHTSQRLLEKRFKKLPYNEIWREWLVQNKKVHFRIEILPRLWPVAGLEHGHELYVNPFPPEKIAQELRALQR
jgi:UDPglucose--hexose-1-phosphate uridylyltransferase